MNEQLVKQCIEWNENVIRGFFKKYRYLSNFYETPIEMFRLKFRSVENAYQAAKVKPECRDQFCHIAPWEAKKLWKQLPLLDESKESWNARKYEIMTYLVFQKFDRSILRQALVDTGSRYLEERNYWGDTIWGWDIKSQTGQNLLGLLIMKVRASI